MANLMQIEMSDEEIMKLLVDALVDITGTDEDITPETKVIDDLALDSLGFLDLFFTIQTSIQREVTNAQMRNLILEELGLDRDPKILKLSDGEKDRVAYPLLQVKHFFNIIKKQIYPELAGVNIEAASSAIFDPRVVDKFIETNFEAIKEKKLEEQLRVNKVTDPRMQEVIRNTFGSITPDSVKTLMSDQKMMNSIVKNFLKDRLDLNNPENLRKFVIGDLGRGMKIREMIESSSVLGQIFDSFCEQRKGDLFDIYLGDEKENFLGKLLSERRDQVIKDLMDQRNENIVLKIFERKRAQILDAYIEEHKKEILASILGSHRETIEGRIVGLSIGIEEYAWEHREEFARQAMKAYEDKLARLLETHDFGSLLSEFTGNEGAANIRRLFEEEKEKYFLEILEREKSLIYGQMVLSSEEKEKLINQLIEDKKDGMIDEFFQKNQKQLHDVVKKEGLIENPEAFASSLLQDSNVQQELIKELIDSQIGNVFEDEIRKQLDKIDDSEILDVLKETFLTGTIKEDKIRQAIAAGGMQGDMIEDFMRENFDQIAMEETKRILQDHELRNKLVQDYIRENYDPMEAMQLNDPQKMKELQKKITQQYLDSHMDEIVSRYVAKYMNEMMEAMPTEAEIEVQGDIQDEFMKKYLAKMEADEKNAQPEEDLSEIEAFAKKYNLEDPMIMSFLESNFEDAKELALSLERVTWNPQRIEKFVMDRFDIKKALYFYYQLFDSQFDQKVRDEFSTFFQKTHMEGLMEMVMKKQLDFMWESNEEEEKFDEYRELLESALEQKLLEMGKNLTDEDLERGLETFYRKIKDNFEIFIDLLEKEFSSEERKKILNHWFGDSEFVYHLKKRFTETYLRTHEQEIKKLSLSQWLDVLRGKGDLSLRKEMEKLQRDFILEEFRKIAKLPTDFSCSFGKELQPALKSMSTFFVDSAIAVVLSSHKQDARELLKMEGTSNEASTLEEILESIRKAVPDVPFSREMTEKRSELKVHEFSRELGIRDGWGFFLLKKYIGEVFEFLQEIVEAYTFGYSSVGRVLLLDILESDYDSQKRSLLALYSLKNPMFERELQLGAFAKFMEDCRAKVESVEKGELGSLFSGYDFTNMCRVFIKDSIDEILAGESYQIGSFTNRASVSGGETLRNFISDLLPSQIEKLDILYSRMVGKLQMSEETFFKVANSSSDRIQNFLQDQTHTLRDDIFVYAQRMIVKNYNLSLLDILSQKLAEPEEYKKLEKMIFDRFTVKHVDELILKGVQKSLFVTEKTGFEELSDMIKDVSVEVTEEYIRELSLQVGHTF